VPFLMQSRYTRRYLGAGDLEGVLRCFRKHTITGSRGDAVQHI
jgi:hypothetical protein